MKNGEDVTVMHKSPLRSPPGEKTHFPLTSCLQRGTFPNAGDLWLRGGHSQSWVSAGASWVSAGARLLVTGVTCTPH